MGRSAPLLAVVAATLVAVVAGLCVDSPPRIEPSGLAYHPRLNKLLTVSDTGEFGVTNIEGGFFTTLGNNGLDLESITFVNETSDYIYLGLEYPPTIIEWHVPTNTESRRFRLPGMPATVKNGMEALTFVPFPASVQGGYFWAGSQYDGGIYVYEVPIVTSTVFEDKGRLIAVHDSYYFNDRHYDDLSDLYYSHRTGTVFGVYGAAKGLVEIWIDKNGFPNGGRTYWDLHETDVEGFAVYVDENAVSIPFLASDTNQQIYSGWFDSDGSVRVACPDGSFSSFALPGALAALLPLIAALALLLL
eukprot:Opistho-1_new@52210